MADSSLKIKDDKQDKDVKAALQVMDYYVDQRTEHDQVVDCLQSLLNEGYTISEPRGARRLSGQLLHQALWRTASRMKPLDFMAHGSGADANIEKIVRDGISTVMDRGEYDSCLRGKNGAFYDLLLYGDALIQVGARDSDKGFPIEFSCGTLKNVYVNTSCTGVRMPQKGRSARKMVIIYTYTKEEFDEKWPKFKDKVKVGEIHRDVDTKDQQLTWRQDNKESDDQVEVAFSYDLNSKTYLIFAGGAHTIIEKKQGDKYPFILDDKPYIPVIHLSFVPSNEGFWNIGIGHLLYRLTIVSRQILNMGTTNIFNNILPIEIINIGQTKATTFFQGVKKAHQMQAQGKRGFIPMERSSGDPNSGAVNSTSLTTQSLYNEWSALYDRLLQEVRRLGINVDELDANTNATATEIIALEENSNALVKQVGEWNASEYQFAVDLTMDMIKQFTKKNDKTPLDLTTKVSFKGKETPIDKVKDEDGEQVFDEITLGTIATELKSKRWFTRVNARSGNILSNTMLYAKWNALMPHLQPGSPQHKAALTGISSFLEVDLPDDPPPQPEPQPGAEGGPPQGGAPQEGAQPMATSTDRQELNPNVAVRGPSIT